MFGRRRIKYAAQILRGGSRKGGILVHANFDENRWPPIEFSRFDEIALDVVDVVFGA